MKGLKEEIEEKEEEDKNDTAGSRARKEETNLKMNEKEHFLAWHRLHIKRRPLPYRSSSLSNLELRLGLQRSLQLAYCMGEARKELARSLLC